MRAGQDVRGVVYGILGSRVKDMRGGSDAAAWGDADRWGVIERYELVHPSVPTAWDGRTVLHLSDFHIRRGVPWPGALERLARWVDEHEVDLAVMTGDYGDLPRDAEAAAGMLTRLVGRIRSRHGVYGVFGNHDGAGFVRRVRGMPGVRWLMGETVEIGAGLSIIGASFPEDLVGAVWKPVGMGPSASVEGDVTPSRAPTRISNSTSVFASGPSLVEGGFRLGLVHDPTEVYSAAAVGVEVVLAGHTHGGQVRWSARVTPHTSCDLPSGFASGMYALGGTVLCVSRGMGEAVARIRVRCPRQAGVYVLRRGELAVGDRLRVVRHW